MPSPPRIEVVIRLDPEVLAHVDAMVGEGIFGDREQAIALGLGLIRRIQGQDRVLIPWCFAGLVIDTVTYQGGGPT